MIALLSTMDEAVANAPRAVVLACSGGVDSVVLARLAVPALRAAGITVVLAHLDHGLRPRDGAADAAFVSALARSLRVPLIRRRQRPGRQLIRALGVQAAARTIRREFLLATARALGAEVWLGHQRDDQLETVWMQREDGRIAPGMAARGPHLLRPLLDQTRVEIEACARALRWSWREDPSNENPRFRRTIARAAVRSLLPAERESLLAESGRAANRLVALTQAVLAAHAGIAAPSSDGAAVLLRGPLLQLPEEVALRLLRSSVPADAHRPPSRAAWLALLRALRRDSGGESRRLSLAGGVTARWGRETVSLRRGESPPEPPLEVAWATVLTRVALARLEAERCRAGRDFAVFDAADPAVVGVRRGVAGRGRRMRPFGSVSRRLVRDLLAEAGAPLAGRAEWPVVENASGEILWLAGVRAAAFAPLRVGSVAALVLYTVTPRRNRPGGPELTRS